MHRARTGNSAVAWVNVRREHAPTGAAFDKAAKWWLSMASSADAQYDDVKTFDASTEPYVVLVPEYLKSEFETEERPRAVGGGETARKQIYCVFA